MGSIFSVVSSGQGGETQLEDLEVSQYRHFLPTQAHTMFEDSPDDMDPVWKDAQADTQEAAAAAAEAADNNAHEGGCKGQGKYDHNASDPDADLEREGFFKGQGKYGVKGPDDDSGCLGPNNGKGKGEINVKRGKDGRKVHDYSCWGLNNVKGGHDGCKGHDYGSLGLNKGKVEGKVNVKGGKYGWKGPGLGGKGPLGKDERGFYYSARLDNVGKGYGKDGQQ
jgi:hypothetical protein